MNCPNCSAEVAAGTKFCSKCGFSLLAAAPEAPQEPVAYAPESYGTPYVPAQPEPAQQPVYPAYPQPDAYAQDAYAPYAPQPEAPVPSVASAEDGEAAKKKRKKLVVILAAALGAAALIALLCILLTRPKTVPADLALNFTSGYRTAEDGVYGYSFAGGMPLHLDGAAKQNEAYVTRDGQKLVCVDEDGALLLYHAGTGAQTVLDKNATAIVGLCNAFVLYETEGAGFSRCNFDDAAPVRVLETDYALITSQFGDNYLCAADGDIRLYTGASGEETVVGGYEDYVSLLSVSDSGNICIWAETRDGGEGEEYLLYGWISGERFIIAELPGSEAVAPYSFLLAFSADESRILIANDACSELFAVDALSRSAARIQLGNTLFDRYRVFTENTRVYLDGALPFDSLYAVVKSDDGGALYQFDKDFNREKLVSGCAEAIIQRGSLYYIDTDGGLYYQKLSDGVHAEPERISSDVAALGVSRDGKRVYFLKNLDSGHANASLYVWKIGERDPEKIASEVYTGVDRDGYLLLGSDVCISLDGQSVWFFRDTETAGGSGERMGTLYRWSVGGSPERIGSDILVGSLVSGYHYLFDLDPSQFLYVKYRNTVGGKAVGNVYIMRDGKSALLAEAVLFN